MPLNSMRVTDGAVHLHWDLDAAPDRVWAQLTDAERLPEWLGRPLSPETATWEEGARLVVDHGDGQLCHSTVLGCDAPSSLELTWEFEDEPGSQVSVQIASEEPGVKSTLLLRHTGLAELTGSYAPGWLTHLSFFEASLAGDPLPLGQFWNLYGTLVQLRSG